MKDHSRMIRSLIVAIVSLLLCFVLIFGFTACGTEGPAGPAGPQGEQGIQGIPGEKGEPGEPGRDATAAGDEYTPSADIQESTVNPTGTVTGALDAKGKFYKDYTSYEEEQREAKKLTVNIAEEGDVLLKNKDGALPLSDTERNVTLFGIRSVNLVAGGSGSGAGTLGANGVEQSTLQSSLEDAGFAVNPKTIGIYQEFTDAGETLEIDVSNYGGSVTNTYNSYGDAAIITFSRIGQEGRDLPMHDVEGHSDDSEHFLQLDDNERALVSHVKQHFDKIIVLINSSNIMQIPELADDDAISAILYIGGVGNNGVDAVGGILSGTVNPSGHTVDLWERDFTKSPTYTNFGYYDQNFDENGNRMSALYTDSQGNNTKYTTLEYREGIYMGYKYYETLYSDAAEADKEKAYSNVLYPFGYGLSYTDFEWKIDNVAETADITAANQTITMRVWVKNTGDVAGKDVVQVYYNPPYTKGGIEKASANLVGFAKTDLLRPGESQVVQVRFVAQDMASFDWNDANKNNFKGYELEAGDYVISINRNSHEIVDSVTRTVKETIKCDTDLTSGNKIEPVFTGDFTTVNDSLRANMISRATGLTQPKPVSAEDRILTDDQIAMYDSQDTYEVYRDKETDPWYVSAVPEGWTQGEDNGLLLRDMAGIVYEEAEIGADNVAVAATDADSQKWEEFMNQFTWEELCSLIENDGGVNIDRLGIVASSNADGPMQISGGTYFPSYPIIAGTFNVDLAYEMGRIMADDALEKEKCGWYGMGANIHRSPFGGRNFEYYSEDGLLSGKIAAATAKAATEGGLICYAKHFFANDQETYRSAFGGVSTWATEQTFREIYLKPFEYIVKAGSLGLMTSFNRVGSVVNSNNWAVHEDLIRDEWGFKGATITDAWVKDYCPVNLAVRAGDDHILRGGNYAKNQLTVGEWSAGDDCVKVADEDGTMVLSPTHYYAVRKAAQRVLYIRANSNANKNGVVAGDIITVTLLKDIYNSVRITSNVSSDIELSLSEGAAMPDGLSLKNGKVVGKPASYDLQDVNVDVVYDGLISSTAVLRFEVVSGMHYNGTAFESDTVIKLKAGEESSIVFDMPHYAYGAYVPSKRAEAGQTEGFFAHQQENIIMNWYEDNFGDKYCRDEDKTLGDVLTLDADKAAVKHEYAWTSSGNVPAGMTFSGINETVNGMEKMGTYEVMTGYKLSGIPTTPGTYTFEVTATVPYIIIMVVTPTPSMDCGEYVYTQTVTVVVE